MIKVVTENIYIEEKGDECFVVQDGKIIKRFYGETSYSDAMRLAMDLMFEEQNKSNYNSHLGWL